MILESKFNNSQRYNSAMKIPPTFNTLKTEENATNINFFNSNTDNINKIHKEIIPETVQS